MSLNSSKLRESWFGRRKIPKQVCFRRRKTARHSDLCPKIGKRNAKTIKCTKTMGENIPLTQSQSISFDVDGPCNVTYVHFHATHGWKKTQFFNEPTLGFFVEKKRLHLTQLRYYRRKMEAPLECGARGMCDMIPTRLQSVPMFPYLS